VSKGYDEKQIDCYLAPEEMINEAKARRKVATTQKCPASNKDPQVLYAHKKSHISKTRPLV